MGATCYSNTAYTAEVTRSFTSGKPMFAHDHAIKTGQVKKQVESRLSPKGVKFRECRDSETHPISLPIGILLDTTGSMAEVPKIIQKNLPNLQGKFVDEIEAGISPLGGAYPAIMTAAVDDFRAQQYCEGNEGTLQVGQFESGIEINDDLTRLWFTQNGGGSYEESYELGLYFFARHTVHDHWEKRNRKGYLFIIGDEHAYEYVSATQVETIIGDKLDNDIPLATIIAEAKERYHVYFIIPNMTSHYKDEALFKYWVKKLGQQNVIRLEDPQQVCQKIVELVNTTEKYLAAANEPEAVTAEMGPDWADRD